MKTRILLILFVVLLSFVGWRFLTRQQYAELTWLTYSNNIQPLADSFLVTGPMLHKDTEYGFGSIKAEMDVPVVDGDQFCVDIRDNGDLTEYMVSVHTEGTEMWAWMPLGRPFPWCKEVVVRGGDEARIVKTHITAFAWEGGEVWPRFYVKRKPYWWEFWEK